MSDPFLDAKAWATGFLYNPDSTKRIDDIKRYAALSGLLNLEKVYLLSGESFQNMIKNHVRSVSTDRTAGTISATETFLIATVPTTGALQSNAARDDFEVSSSFANGVWTFGIAGEVKGFDSNKYTPTQLLWGVGDSDRWRSAKSLFENFSSSQLRTRVQIGAEVAANADNSTGACRVEIPQIPINPTQKTIGMNPRAGTISYDYQWEVFPQFLSTTGEGDYCIISQQISVEDTLATDVYASHVVLGRAAGPLLQDIGTVTAKQRLVSIEIVVPPPTSLNDNSQIGGVNYAYKPFPTGSVQALLGTLTGNIANDADQIFVTQNTENIGFSNGNYTRQYGIIYTTCPAAV